jgi:uncharacterized membrane protein
MSKVSGKTGKGNRLAAVFGYLTPAGWFLGLVAHKIRKSPLGSFHLRQSLGFWVLCILIWIPVFLFNYIPMLGPLTNLALYLSVLLFWISGFLSALSGESKPLPIIGQKFQKWFSSIVPA